MTDTKGDKALSPGAVEAVAGLLAGGISNFVGHPFEMVKTRLQIDQNKAGSSIGNMRTIALKLLKSEQPVQTIYRGLPVNLVGGASSWATFFVLKARTEQFLVTLKAKATPTSTSSTSPQAQLNPADYFVSATVAGGITQLLTNPVWVVKTRMISTDRSSPGAFPNMFAGAATIFRKEGLKGFYTGLTMSLFGVSQGAVQFAIYDPIKNIYLARQRQAAQDNPDGGRGNERLDFQSTVVISTASKLIAQAVVYPYQVIRTRLQNHNAEARFGRGVRGVVRGMWAEAGIRSFYKGLAVASGRMLPSTWATFLVYENTKFYLPRYLSEKQERDGL